MDTKHILPLILLACASPTAFGSEPTIIVKNQVHLRTTERQEWSRFDKKYPGSSRKFSFESSANDNSFCLVLRQSDVRQLWEVKLNDKRVGRLKRDQNDLTTVFEIPKGRLVDGTNQLEVVTTDKKTPDDILVGPISIQTMSKEAFLSQAKLSLVTTNEKKLPIPCRFTIVDSQGSLPPLGIQSNEQWAVREGVVYSKTGKALIKLPAGKYTVYANRGFEFSRSEKSVVATEEKPQFLSFQIKRVVNTQGWVSCDTHVHTVTHSGHGDCTIEERMITLAGECIELPIATDHNKQIDYRPISKKLRTQSFFTPVIGNEITTDFGHFNAFPFTKEAAIPNFKENDWSKLLPEIYSKPNARVAILNHGRDIHRGYRPFAPENFNEVSGESLNDRPFLFNAMEVINSAAQQTDQFELFRDWLAITNRGHKVLPIGSSDSHDVNAFIVGQGRTYIQCDDSSPGDIDTTKAIDNLLKGKISISCGLLAKIKVNKKFGPGDLVDDESAETYEVSCTMMGPGWLPGSQIELYRNGQRIRQSSIPVESTPGLGQAASVVWTLKRKSFDSFLTVLVKGPGIRHPSWPLAQPYQPVSTKWDPKIFGFTGAVYLDENNDGKFSPAYETASEMYAASKGNLKKLVNGLAEFDQAVAIQAASLYQNDSKDLLDKDKAAVWRSGSPSVREGFAKFLGAWRISEAARVAK